MMRRASVVLAVVSSLAVATGADEVDELINALKPSPLDHAVWAERLVKAADGLKDSPKTLGRLYEKAYELGTKQAKGYPAAMQAAEALLETQPDQKAVWQQKLLVVCKLDWQAADRKRKKEAGKAYVNQMVAVADDLAASDDLAEAIELYTNASRMARYYAPERREALSAKLQDARDRQKLHRDIARCQRVLAASPDNAAVRERLIRLLVVELDAPAKAKKLLTPGVAEPWRTYVPLAVKEISELGKPVCLELGDWYMSLAAEATRGGKAKVLTRAKAYYQRFVALETSAVKGAIGKAKMALVEKELRKLGPAAPPRGRELVLDLGKGVTMKLVRIPAGRFLMGSPEAEADRERHEGPRHWVRISRPFHMGVTEVTQGQYEAVMGTNPSKSQGANRPVESVSWQDAVRFCRKLSAKTRRRIVLPTEAQWEYACRAGSKTRFSSGDSDADLAPHGWSRQNSGLHTHEVGKKKPNAWGLHDMHGSIWEWCADWYGEDYYRRSSRTDPQGPGNGSARVLRGGSAFDHPKSCRSALRHRIAPDGRHFNVGLRVASSAGAN